VGVVLVVEDNPTNAVLAEAVLTRAGHQVLMAADGATALDIARRRLPDLVLLDVSLAGCRGMGSSPKTGTPPLSGTVR
jgi:CheY-like chemotaxis protein